MFIGGGMMWLEQYATTQKRTYFSSFPFILLVKVEEL